MVSSDCKGQNTYRLGTPGNQEGKEFPYKAENTSCMSLHKNTHTYTKAQTDTPTMIIFDW